MSHYTAGQKMTYPWLVMHTDHVAFRMKDPDPKGPDRILMPKGDVPEFVSCGNCGRGMNMIGIMTQQWKVSYKPA